jgi:AcrR family transcriptional regulator
MAGGTKRLPRAVREQQMLDAAVQMFSVNGYHETSMDAIAAEAKISKPMLYLYYGSKEELFGACLDRELRRFVDEVRSKIDLTQSPKELLRNAVLSFLTYIDANRASWMVLYTQATSSQAFAHTVREGRERIIDLVGRLLRAGTRHPEPDTDFDMMAVALVGAGEAVATRVSTGDADVDEAAELMINLFWRGLKGTPSDSGGQERSDPGISTDASDRRRWDIRCSVPASSAWSPSCCCRCWWCCGSVFTAGTCWAPFGMSDWTIGNRCSPIGRSACRWR